MKVYLLIIGIFAMTICSSHAQNWKVKEARYHYQPIIQMTLNGKTIWVLLDTGSNISILNITSRDSHKFNTRYMDDDLNVVGFGSEQNKVRDVSGAELYFGETKLKNRLFAYDITNIVASIKARTGKTITAIIGNNIMRNYNFVIDMGTRTASMRYKTKDKNPERTEIELMAAKNP